MSYYPTNTKMAFITRLYKSIKLLLLPILLAVSFQAAAEGINITRAKAQITPKGQLAISSRFQTELPDQLKHVLIQGVPLHFSLSFQLSSPTLAAYKFKIGQVIGNSHAVAYKLSYHPLTSRYRVSVGTFSTEYNSLESALKAVGSIANWHVLNTGTLNKVSAAETKAEIRLTLSTAQLPKPFQINALTSKNWQLDSGWKPLTVIRE